MSEQPHDPQHHKYIQHHGPVHSEPVTGHEGTSYEGTDASVGFVLGSLAIIAATLVVTALLTFPIQNLLKKANPLGSLPSPLAPARVIPPTPRIQVQPWNTLPQLRAHENAVLNGSGKDASGGTYVPITQAIDGVGSQLKIRPDAPSGLTVPGGQGLDFSHNLGSMPAAYQSADQTAPTQPTIKGDIRKNAQK